MDAWRPQKKRAADMIENALCMLGLLSMGTVLLIIAIVAA